MLKGINIDVTKIVIIVVILIVVIAIIYGVYRWGKSKTEPSIKDLPKKVTGGLTKVEIEDLSALAKNLHSDMEGLSFTNDEKLYYKASVLTDRMLIGLSNVFNSYYEVNSGQSLLQWLKNESFTSMFNDIDVYADTIEMRLVDLGLT